MGKPLTLTLHTYNTQGDEEYIAVLCVFEFVRRAQMSKRHRDLEDQVAAKVERMFISGVEGIDGS